MPEKERIFIIIDGNNFYHRLKELKFRRLLSFDYEKFVQFLLRKEKLLISKNYYIGAVREEPNNPKSKGLITHSDIRRLLTKEDIEQFFNKYQ